MKTTIDFNSSTNQRIKGEFIAREVLANATRLVEFSLTKSLESDADSPIHFDEIDLYRFNHSGSLCVLVEATEEQKQEEIDRLTTMLDEEGADIDSIQEEIDELKELEAEPVEIFEWWIITDGLAKRLEEKGEVITSDGYNQYWGRCATGQAIMLDYVISEVCHDMRILEGQSNEWR